MPKKIEIKRTMISFDCGNQELKDKAIKLAKEFSPVKISLSSLCQVALKDYIGKNSK